MDRRPAWYVDMLLDGIRSEIADQQSLPDVEVSEAPDTLEEWR